MPEPLTVPFGEWLPDRPDFANPGATEALNVIPSIDGYRPLRDIVVYSNALTARCQGAFAAQDTGGNQKIYAGDATKLYRLDSTTFTEVSKSAAVYTTAEDSTWEFVQFGGRAIATNFDDPVQGASLSGSATFADLITSTDKPAARHIAVVGEFVVLGNTTDTTDGPQPNRAWWCGIRDPVDFTPAAATQCDFQNIEGGGWLQRIVGGADYGLVFLEREIHRMTYTGSPLVFRFDAIDRQRGTPIPNSVIGYGRQAFFISDEGFFVNDGVQSVPIGDEKVDRTFWDQFDVTYVHRVSSAIDPIAKIVLWAFPGTGSTAGSPNRLFIYHWPTRRWAQALINTQIIVPLTSEGYTLDGLDTVGTDIDNATLFPFSFDSRAWTGGQIKLAAFDTSQRLNFFDGTHLVATLETSEFQPFNGYRSKINSVRLLVDGGSGVTAAVASRTRIRDTVTYGTAAAINTDGECPLRSEGRYHRVRCSLSTSGTASGVWTHAQGVQVPVKKTGKR